MRNADAVVIVDTLSRQLSATRLSAKDAMFSGECDAARRDPGNRSHSRHRFAESMPTGAENATLIPPWRAMRVAFFAIVGIERGKPGCSIAQPSFWAEPGVRRSANRHPALPSPRRKKGAPLVRDALLIRLGKRCSRSYSACASAAASVSSAGLSSRFLSFLRLAGRSSAWMDSSTSISMPSCLGGSLHGQGDATTLGVDVHDLHLDGDRWP